jgi:hypothetical protein
MKAKNREMQKKEDEKFQKIRDRKEMKKSYLSTVSTKFNPDLLIGESLGELASHQTFLRGNQYHSNDKVKKTKKKREAKANLKASTTPKLKEKGQLKKSDHRQAVVHSEDEVVSS